MTQLRIIPTWVSPVLQLISLSAGFGIGCHAQDATRVTKSTTSTATVVVFRPNKFLAHGVAPRVMVDGQYVADLTHRRYFILKVPAGNHTFTTNWVPHDEKENNRIKAGVLTKLCAGEMAQTTKVSDVIKEYPEFTLRAEPEQTHYVAFGLFDRTVPSRRLSCEITTSNGEAKGSIRTQPLTSATETLWDFELITAKAGKSMDQLRQMKPISDKKVKMPSLVSTGPLP